MYAIIEDGGHQYRVEEGQELEVDFRKLSAGDEFKFARVLALRDETGLKVGQPALDSVVVTAEVLGASQGPKLVIQKFRRRKTVRCRTGHRQIYTQVKIKKIETA